jgi:O-antigen ligase
VTSVIDRLVTRRDRDDPARRRGHLVVGRGWRRGIRIALLIALGGAFAAGMTLGILRFLNIIVRLAGIPPELVGLVIAIALPVAAVVMVALFVVPVQIIPTIALLILTLAPTRFIPSDGPFNALPPLAILMGIWVFRRIVLGQTPDEDVAVAGERRPMGPRFAIGAVAVLLLFWLILSTALEGGSDTTVGWTLAFAVSVLMPLLVPNARAEARLLAQVVLVVGVLVGLYLLVEMVLKFSPVYGAPTEEFEFSVYRARAAFSHPLFAAAFMTIPASIGIGAWLQSGKFWPLFAAAISVGGIVATVSRGSVAAVGVAVAFALLLAPMFLGWKNISRWAQLLVVSAIGAVVVLNAGPLVERSDSIESQISADVRDRAVDVAFRAADLSGWIGTGPGTSGVTSRLFDTIIIENSILQLLISIGIPGLLLFALFMTALIWQACTRGNLSAILAMTAYVVALSGFNSIDAVRTMHILLGFLVILAVHGRGDDAAQWGRPNDTSALSLSPGGHPVIAPPESRPEPVSRRG